MCGIAGIWGPSDPQQIEAMVSSMRHRGPDDQGIYQDNYVALGMTRLAVIDIHPSGHQPMSTPDGNIWIVYNGELYNFKQERKILESYGYTFRSTSDTEVVLRMYVHYGDDFLTRLRGIFALAIYDKRKGLGCERLLLARDHFGIKPLMYTKSGEKFIFGSEIKAMLASGLVLPKVNPVGLRLLLTFGSVYQPHTIVESVQMLLPAHRLILENGRGIRIERYWSLGIDRNQGVRGLSYEKQVALLDSTLRETVAIQMVSDVPLGAFISGGVDSSILVALMAQVADHKIKTFSIGFENEGADIDESEDAKKTAQYIGTDHSHVLVKGSDVNSRIRHIAAALDQPSVDGVNSYFVSLAARKEVTVTISGTGGDEIFAGYPWFISMEKYQRSARQSPLNFHRHKNTLKEFSHHLLDLGLRRNRSEQDDCYPDDFLTKYASNYYIFGSKGAKALIPPALQQSSQVGLRESVELKKIDELSYGSAVERVSGLVLRGYTNNQLLRDIDAVAMSHSLEVRVPYLDPVIADLSLSLPDNAKLGDTEKFKHSNQITYRSSGAKRILIDVGRSILPVDFDLQPKRGFGMPFDAWLHGPLNVIFEDTLSNSCVRERELLKTDEVQNIRKRYYEGKTGWAQPWLLMMLELWCREVLDSTIDL